MVVRRAEPGQGNGHGPHGGLPAGYGGLIGGAVQRQQFRFRHIPLRVEGQEAVRHVDVCAAMLPDRADEPRPETRLRIQLQKSEGQHVAGPGGKEVQVGALPAQGHVPLLFRRAPQGRQGKPHAPQRTLRNNGRNAPRPAPDPRPPASRRLCSGGHVANACSCLQRRLRP
ncbi:hypothetical protein DEIPH_ctg044orf0018 [Deinococcus phoenicis]|uniref:Uncharacterized protein n=1 Tax=Deinococcus phoenicis TaxID=1476583 RepID=A0A016QMS7_9DEIO|nr:hypothetical protein DEIPH_ctg044orf0018 [Deinococcus phoenicis]